VLRLGRTSGACMCLVCVSGDDMCGSSCDYFLS
jgi:hypothetical protein